MLYKNVVYFLLMVFLVLLVSSCKPATEQTNTDLEASVGLEGLEQAETDNQDDMLPVTDQHQLAQLLSIQTKQQHQTHHGMLEWVLDDNNQADRQHSWWSNTTMYQIWISSFYDSDHNGYGDIQGIIQQFDYLLDLGVDALLLSPIFPTSSYHGYNVTDYLQINPLLGTMHDFNALVALAHQHHMKIILDLPLNHTSDQHPWFIQSQQQDPTFAEYYLWSPQLPTDYGLPWQSTPDPSAVWHTKQSRKGWYYGLFGYSNPDLNYTHPPVRKAIRAVFKHWIELGVDGFRIDAARHFIETGGLSGQADSPQNLALIHEWVAYVKTLNEQVFLIGETYTSIERSIAYLEGPQGFDGIFNFEFYSSLRDLYTADALNQYHQAIPAKSDAVIDQEKISQDAQHHTDLNNMMDKAVVKNAIMDMYQRLHHYSVKGKSLVIFLNNHDVTRFIAPQPHQDSIYRILSTLTLLSPFNVSIYYGEEVAARQLDHPDPLYQRGLMPWSDTPHLGFHPTTHSAVIPWVDQPHWFPWLTDFTPWSQQTRHPIYNVKVQQQNPQSLLSHYQKLIHLKQQDPVFSAPDILHFDTTNHPYLWSVTYRNAHGRRLVMINLNPLQFIQVTIPPDLSGQYVELLQQQTVDLKTEISLKPGQVWVLTTKAQSHQGIPSL